MVARKKTAPTTTSLLTQRLSGILLHPTSLPGGHGIGDLGSSSRACVDFLSDAKQRIWQMLPTGPTTSQDYHSPYNCTSAFAGNPLLVSLDDLVSDGLLTKRDLAKSSQVSPKESKQVQFGAVEARKYPLLSAAAQNFAGARAEKALTAFCESEPWVETFAQFAALRRHFKKDRDQWPRDLIFAPSKLRRDQLFGSKASAATTLLQSLKDDVRNQLVIQYFFFEQWKRLRDYGIRKEVQLLGDLPIYVSNDSADVWGNPEFFEVDRETGKAVLVSGVPPDVFNSDGQLWGHPLYRWKAIEKSGFQWWKERFRTLAKMFAVVRVDHFRGFESFWSIDGDAKTAKGGSWKPCPGEKLFSAVKDSLGDLPLFVEDLGIITPPVNALREAFGFMGTRVLQFAFSGEPTGSIKSRHHPINIPPNSVVYSGTHDNAPAAQWFNELPAANKTKVVGLLNDCAVKDVPHQFIRLAMGSAAKYCIVTMQDVIGGGKSTRMNSPGTHSNANWSWRLEEFPKHAAKSLAHLSDIYERNV